MLSKHFLLVAVMFCCGVIHGAEKKLFPEPAGQDMIRENGAIRMPARTKNLSLVPEGGFQEGKFYEFKFNFAEGTTVDIISGRLIESERKEKDASPKYFNEAINIKCEGQGVSLRAMTNLLHFKEPWKVKVEKLALNYIMPALTFETMDNVARWQENYANEHRRDLAKEEIRLGVAVTDTRMIVYINGVGLGSISRIGNDLKQCVLKLSGKETVFCDMVEIADLNQEFLPVEISEKANAAGFDGKKLKDFSAGKEIHVNGVPFKLSENKKNDNIDLSVSWMESGLRGGYDECAGYTRWRSATANTPMRFQFRLPYDNYDTLYVLAASSSAKDYLPNFSLQFYRGGVGIPVNYKSERVPLFQETLKSENALPVKTSAGRDGQLYLIKIKLDPGILQEFNINDFINMELTKEVMVYRSGPDPIWHSMHGAGLPSAVRIFGITMGYSRIKASFTPDSFANVWKEGEKVSYSVKVQNVTNEYQKIKLNFTAKSRDGQDEYSDSKTLDIKHGEVQEIKFQFSPKRFGHYNVRLVKDDTGGIQTFNRTLAYLRSRDYSPRSFFCKGMMYGTWPWGYTPERTRLAGMMGFEQTFGTVPKEKELQDAMKEYGLKSFQDMGYGGGHGQLRIKYGDEPDQALEKAIKELSSKLPQKHERAEPVFTTFFSEPGGIGTNLLPEFFGEEPYDYKKLTGEQKKRYENYKFSFLIGRKAAKQLSPNTKILMPYGDFLFTTPFLQDPETRNLFDGVSMDQQYYTRLPEQQVHQCSFHAIYMFRKTWEKFRPGEKPLLVYNEGPNISPVLPGANDEENAAALYARSMTIMAGYGANHQFSWVCDVIANSNSENHCSAGFVGGPGLLNPYESLSAVATHTRHTRNALFESYTNPGSFSAYCANFRNSDDNKLLRIMWNIRGKREFILDTPPHKLKVYDNMDNLVDVGKKDGKSVLVIGKTPLYVYGTDENTKISLGAVDHSDSKLGEIHVKLGNIADIFGIQTNDADENYVNAFPEKIRRYYAKMQIDTERVEPAFGEKALSVFLPKQEKDRGIMPYYTCLKLKNPVAIAGKGKYLSMWVKASSDWGRVVYVLRDAKGKLWYSVGFRDTWNVDDMPGDSSFCFDSWRLLRFELPANAPWDNFRELGLTNWGSDEAQSIVELPLSIEKIFVERRQKVMYGNDLCDIKEEKPVLFGDIYVEYADKADMTDEVVRLSKIRVPTIESSALPNPVANIKNDGKLPPGKITAVKDPDTWFNGRRGVFEFEAPSNAVSFDIWVSQYPDGKGALLLGKGIKKSGGIVQGFLPNADFYAFLVYRDKDGSTSLPSDGFKFRMKDHFAHQ